jgi:peptidoglycan/xylan/chitin deacetylase (PgdA/CDA1 family)
MVLLAMTAVLGSLKPQTIILTYHDMVAKRDSHALWFDCTPSELNSQLDRLQKAGFAFISLDELYSHLRDKTRLAGPAVAITFADNYEGFFKFAWPILSRRRIPVAMFIHTDYVGNQSGRPKMSWAQLQELCRSPLFLAESQTRTHPADLRTMADSAVMKEFSGSKQALTAHLKNSARYIAYPNGKYDARIARLAKAAGYEMGFTEAQIPAESSPGLFMLARYVHTKLSKAMSDLSRR